MRPAARLRTAFFALVCFAGTPHASRAVSLAVDLDPSTAAIEDDAAIGLGETRTLAIRIADVSAAEPLNAFELDLSFAFAVLSVLTAQSGDFLALPIETIELDLVAPDVNLAFTTLGPGAVSGSGVLALVTVQGAALGTSALVLDDVLLSAPFGEPIAVDALAHATLRVIPEPATCALVAIGCALLARRRA
jgi:hypothetical protein